MEPKIGNPIIKKIANKSKTVLDGEKVTGDYLHETGVGLSESVVILVAMAMGLGEMLHPSPPKCRKRPSRAPFAGCRLFSEKGL